MIRKPKPEMSDDDNPAWTAEDFARSQPARKVLAEQFGTRMAEEMLKPRGRPRLANPKERINIRLSHEVIEHFKASGQGWQSRINAVLVDFVKRGHARAKR